MLKLKRFGKSLLDVSYNEKLTPGERGGETDIAYLGSSPNANGSKKELGC